VEFEILPFSFYEYTDFLDQEKNRKNLLDYLASGALPELFNLKNKESKIHYMSSLKDTILLRDIIQRYHIKDAALLNDIFTYLVNNISNLVSITNIINYFKSKNRKTNYETISNYISYLLQTFVIHQAERFDIKGKDILSGNTKFYLNDLAFKNLLFPSILHGSGYILENYVYTELRRNGFQIFVGAFRAGEVDFVATKNNKTLYIQVCFDFQNPETAKREYKSLLSIKDNYEKWIVTMDEFVLQDYKGIKHYQAWKLEEELKKLEL
jgi:predicted AAA+ superfamily ATPase